MTEPARMLPVVKRRTCTSCGHRRHCFLMLQRFGDELAWLCCFECVSLALYRRHLHMVFVEEF